MTQEKMIQLCQGQLEAYNRGDIEKFCSFYHPEVVAYRLPSSEPFVQGLEPFKALYHRRFSENPKLHCELRSRTVLGSTVLDEEWVTGVVNQDRGSHVVAIYQFRDGLIHSIWFAS